MNAYIAKCPKLLEDRLSAIASLLKAVHQGGSGMSAATVGYEREAIANLLVGNVIAPPFRLGSGDILDAFGAQSGQMDIVVEQTPSISFPLISGLHPRLYLAEGVAAVVEVKSNIAKQWEAVKDSSAKLAKLCRSYEDGGVRIGELSQQIPHFVVGYTGWDKPETLADKLINSALTGVLSIDPCVYCSRRDDAKKPYEWLSGPIALARFMVEIEVELRRQVATQTAYRKYDQRLDYPICVYMGGGHRFRQD